MHNISVQNVFLLAVGRYPKALDMVLEEHLKDVTDQTKQDLFHQFISLSLSGGKYEVDTDLWPNLSLRLLP